MKKTNKTTLLGNTVRVGDRVVYQGVYNSVYGQAGEVKEIHSNENVTVVFDNGITFKNVHPRNLTILNTYSRQSLNNPTHSYKYGDSTISYKIKDNRLKMRVDGAPMDLDVALSILLKDKNITGVVFKKKNPYKLVYDETENGEIMVHRLFKDAKEHDVEKLSLCLRYSYDKNGNEVLEGYQKVFVPDLLLYLEELGYTVKNGDGFKVLTDEVESYEVEDMMLSEEDKKILALEADGWIIPSK